MDAYEDTLRALEELRSRIISPPSAERMDEDRSNDVRDEYARHMKRTAEKASSALRHLEIDGFVIPSTYVWRRWQEVVDSGLFNDVWVASMTEARAEAERVIQGVKQDLARMKESGELEVRTALGRTDALLQEAIEPATTDAPVKKKRENVGYGWPARIAFAGAGTAAWIWAYPRLASQIVSNVEHNTSYALGLLASSLTVFFGMIALGNIIRKP